MRLTGKMLREVILQECRLLMEQESGDKPSSGEVMAGLVNSQAEGCYVFALGLYQSHVGVMYGVFLFDPFTTVPTVLGTTITDQEHQLR